MTAYLRCVFDRNTMMAGLESVFQSRVNQNGATANSSGGDESQKGDLFQSPSPEVSVKINMDSSSKHHVNTSTTQVPREIFS